MPTGRRSWHNPGRPAVPFRAAGSRSDKKPLHSRSSAQRRSHDGSGIRIGIPTDLNDNGRDSGGRLTFRGTRMEGLLVAPRPDRRLADGRATRIILRKRRAILSGTQVWTGFSETRVIVLSARAQVIELNPPRSECRRSAGTDFDSRMSPVRVSEKPAYNLLSPAIQAGMDAHRHRRTTPQRANQRKYGHNLCTLHVAYDEFESKLAVANCDNKFPIGGPLD